MDIALLSEYLEASLKSFLPNELAYLSLTRKNELPVRDRLAYKIFRANPHLVSSREYRYIDLALFRNAKSLEMTCMIEVKSWYTFDLTDQLEKVVQAAKIDFAKERNVGMLNEHANAKQYAIIIATHPKQPVSRKYSGVVKYLDRLNRMTRSNGLADIPKICNRNVRQVYAEPAYRVEQVSCSAGTAFGCDVDVYAWIIEKIK